jgi:phosphoribosylformylglycinamidine synthase PurS subunit
VVVMLKPGLADPQGSAVQDALPTMGWTGVSDVRVGKHIELTVEAESEEAARAVVEEIGGRLLSNPVIEEFRVLTAEDAS